LGRRYEPSLKEADVATYITLLKWTEQGIRNIKGGPQRLDAARQAIQQAGGNMREFFMVLGDYDAVSVVELPDDETYARFILSVAAQGNVSTTTLKAFTEDEYRRIVGALP
jgi:uncharacterized protein with GYD domain